MRFFFFFILGLAVILITFRADWLYHITRGAITGKRLNVTRFVLWLLLSIDWFYILWCNKKRQAHYRRLIEEIGTSGEQNGQG